MKRAWLTFTLSLCFGLVVATAYVLLLATPVLAATGTATCKNAPSVTCAAYRCNCSDGIGCLEEDANGNESVTRCAAPSKDDKPIAVAESES